jgi:hypothetical protein
VPEKKNVMKRARIAILAACCFTLPWACGCGCESGFLLAGDALDGVAAGDDGVADRDRIDFLADDPGLEEEQEPPIDMPIEDPAVEDPAVDDWEAPAVYAWARTYGSTGDDWSTSIQPTSDGGYVFTGFYGPIGENFARLWVVKLDAAGEMEWQRTYGPASYDYEWLHFIRQTSDGGYIIGADTDAFGAGGWDMWILKLDGAGDVQWQKVYGGPGDDWGYSVVETADGGYVADGLSSSFGMGSWDLWVVRLDSAGSVLWQKTYGGPGFDYLISIQQTTDGGFVAAGHTQSFGSGQSDLWALRLDADGNILWQKTYGGTRDDRFNCAEPARDGGIIAIGSTRSFGAGWDDIWVLKLDAQGSISDACPPGIGLPSSAVAADTPGTMADTDAVPLAAGAVTADTGITPASVDYSADVQCSR